jgi:hypothetical protein
MFVHHDRRHVSGESMEDGFYEGESHPLWKINAVGGVRIKCRELSARIAKDSEGGLLRENFGDYRSHASG